ncbi:MFS transporter [Acetobacteraceae bacterium KSS8]|uniref:MFS transporter n=1 Tax=Endosaccharibacter trunci TaxID=2812733 RepID=A0ABT1W4G8_9PROT|nr:MFS transporter [Acetobacteraceae bacterium KSS8]
MVNPVSGQAAALSRQRFPSRRATRMRVLALALLMIAGTVNYLDRSALSIGNSSIRADLRLDDAQMGLLLSAFSVAYGLAQIPVGILIDRAGPRRVMGAGLVLWSGAQMAAGFVGGLAPFVAARAALGIGESPMYLAGTKVCSNWFRASARAFPIGLFNASSALGPAIAPLILTTLLLAYGWRTMFVAVGALGLLIALAWVLVYRDPDRHGLSGEEQDWIVAEDEPDETAPAGWTSLLRDRTAWGMAIGFVGVVYLTWLYGTWLPDYLQRARHLSIAQAGIWTAVPQGCGFLGALLGGAASRLLTGRGVRPLASCRLPLVAGMLVTAACTASAVLVNSTAAAIALVCVALFAASLASSCGWAMAAVATTHDKVATLEAFQNVGGSVGAAAAPALTGFMVQATGSFTAALLLAALVAVLTALIYGFGTRERETGKETR